MAAEPDSVMSEMTVAATGNNTGTWYLRRPSSSSRPDNACPVLVNVNGYEYRNTADVMGARRRDLGLQLAAAVIDGAATHGGQGRRAPLPRQGSCTGGSRLWLPGLRLAFQKTT